MEPDIIHERADEEYPASSRLEKVLRVERIRNLRISDPASLVPHDDPDSIGRQLKDDSHALFGILLVAVLDGIRHRFTDGQADPIQVVCAESRQSRDTVRDLLHQIENPDITPKSELDLAPFR